MLIRTDRSVARPFSCERAELIAATACEGLDPRLAGLLIANGALEVTPQRRAVPPPRMAASGSLRGRRLDLLEAVAEA